MKSIRPAEAKYLNTPGLNVQWPWSELIVSGAKTVETRAYPLPKKHLNTWIAIIETAGSRGKKQNGTKKARIVGLVRFSRCFQYRSKKAWLEDHGRHRVPPNDPLFSYDPKTEKWGWEISEVLRLSKVLSPPKTRGIVFATNCKIPREVVKRV